jgi:hypothetical protein
LRKCDIDEVLAGIAMLLPVKLWKAVESPVANELWLTHSCNVIALQVKQLLITALL